MTTLVMNRKNLSNIKNGRQPFDGPSNMSTDNAKDDKDKKISKSIHSSSFPLKLFHMLQTVERSNQEHIVSWNYDGRSFHVRDPSKFVNEVLPYHFRQQTKYKSFQRRLQVYGFQQIKSGPFIGSYQHPAFNKEAQNGEELCTKIKKRVVATAVTTTMAMISKCNDPSSANSAVKEDSIDTNSRATTVSSLCTSTTSTPSTTDDSSVDSEGKNNSTICRSVDYDLQATDEIEPLSLSITQHPQKRNSFIEDGTRLSFVGGRSFHFLNASVFTDIKG